MCLTCQLAPKRLCAHSLAGEVGIDLPQYRQGAITAAISTLVDQVTVLDVCISALGWGLHTIHSCQKLQRACMHAHLLISGKAAEIPEEATGQNTGVVPWRTNLICSPKHLSIQCCSYDKAMLSLMLKDLLNTGLKGFHQSLRFFFTGSHKLSTSRVQDLLPGSRSSAQSRAGSWPRAQRPP